MKDKAILFRIGFFFFCGAWISSLFTTSKLKWEIKNLNYQIQIKDMQIVQLEDYASNQLVVVRYATEEEQKVYEQEIVNMIAKTVDGEAGGLGKTQQAAVVWNILNRKDSDRFPNDIISVITQPGQYDGYNESNPVRDDIVKLVEDVLCRYENEKNGTFVGSSGRVLPKEYLFFRGNGKENIYRTGNSTKDYWDWSWGTVYND